MQLNDSYTVRFEDSDNDQELTIKANEQLADVLDSLNSPILMGCRTGICAICACKIKRIDNGELAPADSEEQEMLELYADGVKNARLACQIQVTADLTIEPLESAS